MSPKRWIVVLLLGLISAACTSVATPSATVCEGVDAQLGGCDRAQPTFTAVDCPAVGREFGAQLDERTLAILNGPDSLAGQARSVRLRQAMVLVSARANEHLRERGMHTDCDVPEFLAAAEQQFSDAMRDGVGGALYDGDPPATYQEWLAELTMTLGVIDAEEEGG